MTMETEPDAKRQKIEPQIETLRCEFWMEKKKRQCGMQKKAGLKLCTEHMAQLDGDDERVPCPLDSKHTVKVRDMKKHLLKCNARPKEKDLWFCEDINLHLDESTHDVEDDHDEHHYFDLLKQLEFEELPSHICSHEGLLKKLGEVLNQKHALQQSSLIGNLKRLNQLSTDTFYMEYGCGKGELSRYVNLCAMRESEGQSSGYGFGFIDRGVNRQKVDNRLIKDCKEKGITTIVKRSRIDIKDLDVSKFLQATNAEKVMIISKHLCGVATDLTLCLVLKSDLISKSQFQGMLIAMCCRHVCSYALLLPESKRYLACMGFPSSKSFDVLKKAVSWAVSGDDLDKAKLGLVARRIIDESRAIAMQKRLKNYNVELFKYVERSTTLENVCLSITNASA